MKNKIIIAMVSVSALSACVSNLPKSTYFDRGQPETLLQTTDEVTSINISNHSGIARLSSAVKSSQPSSAVVTCANELLCNEAVKVLEASNVPYERQRGAINNVSISYTQVQARDCESSFITNHINPYNLNHPTFGCAIAVNQVQMVSDKRQYTDPLLLGPYDGQKATQNYDSYLSRGEVAVSTQSATGQ
jgi:type IV pilus biogenesis protein CpaD/CtpE